MHSECQETPWAAVVPLSSTHWRNGEYKRVGWIRRRSQSTACRTDHLHLSGGPEPPADPTVSQQCKLKTREGDIVSRLKSGKINRVGPQVTSVVQDRKSHYTDDLYNTDWRNQTGEKKRKNVERLEKEKLKGGWNWKSIAFPSAFWHFFLGCYRFGIGMSYITHT